MGDIRFACKHASCTLKIDETGAGLPVNCPKCGGAIRVPLASDRSKTSVAIQQQPANTRTFAAKGSDAALSSANPTSFSPEELFSHRSCGGVLPGCIIASLVRDKRHAQVLTLTQPDSR